MCYVLLLRGINVGGKNRVDMKELKAKLSEAGFANVVTYINSGNIFFDSDLDKSSVGQKLGEVLSKNYEFALDFALFSSAECQKQADELPA